MEGKICSGLFFEDDVPREETNLYTHIVALLVSPFVFVESIRVSRERTTHR